MPSAAVAADELVFRLLYGGADGLGIWGLSYFLQKGRAVREQA